jgi:hypothetical protein
VTYLGKRTVLYDSSLEESELGPTDKPKRKITRRVVAATRFVENPAENNSKESEAKPAANLKDSSTTRRAIRYESSPEEPEDKSMDKLINKPLEKRKATLVLKPERKKSVRAAGSPPEGIRQSNRVPEQTKRYVP